MRNDKGTTSLEVDALGRPQALREQPTRVPKSIARESVSIFDVMDSRRIDETGNRGTRGRPGSFRIDIVACPSRERKPAGGPGPDRADARGGTPVGPAQTAIVSAFYVFLPHKTAYRVTGGPRRAGFCRVAVEVCRVAVKLCRAIKSYPVEFLSSSCRVPVEFPRVE